MDENATPFDLLSSDNYTTQQIRDERYDMCKSCDRLMITKQCKECFCFMPLKTWLKNAQCDIGKWGMIDEADGT